MCRLRTLTWICIAWHWVGCSSPPPSLLPLGLGPLSLVERASATETLPGRTHVKLGDNEVTSSPPEPETESGPTSDGSGGRDARDAKPNPSPSSDAKITAADPKATSSSGSNDAWLGLYRGHDTTTFLVPEQPERRFDDSKAKIRVDSATGNRLRLALIDSSNEKDICILSASLPGDVATIESGQSCFLEPDEDMTVKSRPGTAKRRDRHLTVDLVLDTLMETEVGEMHGSIEYHFEGDR